MPEIPDALDVVVYTDNASTTAFRRPREIARLLNANGFRARTVIAIDRDTGLTSACHWDEGESTRGR